MSAVDDIQRLFDQIRGFPAGFSENTFDLFDGALDQLERTSSLARLYGRPGTAVDFREEESMPAHWPGIQRVIRQPRRHPPSRTLRRMSLRSAPRQSQITSARLRTMVSDLEVMVRSRRLPSREEFPAVRRAFDNISAHLGTNMPSPAALQLIGTAQGHFWTLARRVFPGALFISVGPERRASRRGRYRRTM